VTTPERQVSLLRGINVGGKVMLPMARLREIYAEIGAEDVLTVLQSGNVVFRHARPPAEVSRLARAAIKAAVGLDIVVIGRSHQDLVRILAERGFGDALPNQRFVVFLADRPAKDADKGLESVTSERESIQLVGAELHMHLRDGAGRSRLQLPVIERKLGVSGTARNWNTVTKLAALSGSGQ